MTRLMLIVALAVPACTDDAVDTSQYAVDVDHSGAFDCADLDDVHARAAAEAGVRISLHEPVPDSTAQLAMDFIGSDFGRLSSLYPDPADLQFQTTDFTAFDQLRRRSVRGDVLASAIGAVVTLRAVLLELLVRSAQLARHQQRLRIDCISGLR